MKQTSRRLPDEQNETDRFKKPPEKFAMYINMNTNVL